MQTATHWARRIAAAHQPEQQQQFLGAAARKLDPPLSTFGKRTAQCAVQNRAGQTEKKPTQTQVRPVAPAESLNVNFGRCTG
jgi:hypothetical protein